MTEELNPESKGSSEAEGQSVDPAANENPTNSGQVPGEAEKGDPIKRVQDWQSKADQAIAETQDLQARLAQQEAEKDAIQAKLVSKMDEEERERFEALQKAESESLRANQAEAELRSHREEADRNELIKDFPRLARWKDSFHGTKPEMEAAMKMSDKQLEESYEEMKKAESEEGSSPESASPAAEASGDGTISKEEFKKLKLPEMKKVISRMRKVNKGL